MPASSQWIFAAAVLLALDAQGLRAQETWSADLAAAVSRERESQGLPPVLPSEALRKTAQAHAEDMVQSGYFALEGPPGSPTIESLLDQEGYRFTLVTEKLVRTPLEETVEHLVAGWHAAPGANRSSLFLADVREIGVGVVESDGQRTVAIVLASATDPAAVPPQAAALSALARDPAAARKALCAAIDKQRLAWGLSTLRVDALLGEAAAQHAKDVLAARMENRPASEVVSLADLVAEQRARSGAPVPVSGEVTRHRRTAPRGNGVGESVGHVIVTDASSPEEALAVALQQTSSALRDARYRNVAVGLAVHPPTNAGESGRSVWVIALATH